MSTNQSLTYSFEKVLEPSLLFAPEAPRINWSKDREKALREMSKRDIQLVVNTGCYNYIDLERSKDKPLAGLHEDHLEHFNVMAQVASATRSKVVIFINDDVSVARRKGGIVLPLEERTEAIKSNPFCLVSMVIPFREEEELIKYSGLIKPYILVKDSSYQFKEITMARGHCQLIVMNDSPLGLSSSESNKKWNS